MYLNSRLLDRHVLEKFYRSQHQLLLITLPRFALAVASIPVKQWNFCKAKCSHYIALTNKFAKTLLPPDSFDVDVAYQLMLLHLSWSEMGDIRLFTASHLNLSLKKRLTFGGPQH